jgi:hypothetical protein
MAGYAVAQDVSQLLQTGLLLQPNSHKFDESKHFQMTAPILRKYLTVGTSAVPIELRRAILSELEKLMKGSSRKELVELHQKRLEELARGVEFTQPQLEATQHFVENLAKAIGEANRKVA